jgi:RNA polymerase sigma factor (TIGR02999 family)
MTEVTQILSKIELGDPSAAEQLMPLVYDELRRLAAAKLTDERPGKTLQATALVHEAYVRLVDVEKAGVWNSRGHFFAAAAEAMRRILVEMARQERTLKRGGAHRRVNADPDRLQQLRSRTEILQVHDSLDALHDENPRIAELVKTKYFAGMSLEQSAEAMGISVRTAHRYWAYAKAWLRRAIEDQSNG